MTDATEYRVRALEQKCSKLYVDMYEGDGRDNTPMTVRVAGLEKCVADSAENTRLAGEDNRKTRHMMVGTMLTVLATVGSAIIAHLMGVKL